MGDRVIDDDALHEDVIALSLAITMRTLELC